MTWTAKQNAKLTKLWLEGKPIREIAVALGYAVGSQTLVGRYAATLGLPSRARKRAPHVPTPKFRNCAAAPPPAAGSASTAGQSCLASGQPCELPPHECDPPYAGCLTVGDLWWGACRWPIGKPVRYCGRQISRGSYCKHHAAVAYRKPAPPKRAGFVLNLPLTKGMAHG